MTIQIVQSVFAVGGSGGLTNTMTSPVTAGNILVSFVGKRNAPPAPETARVNNTGGRVVTFAEFTSQLQIRSGDIAGGDNLFAGWVLATGDEQVLNWNYTNVSVATYEISGVIDPAAFIGQVLSHTATTSSTRTIGTFSNTLAGHIYLQAYILDSVSDHQTMGTGWVADYEAGDGSGHPEMSLSHNIDSPTLPLTASVSGSSLQWAGIAIDLIGDTLTCNPRIIDNFNRVESLTVGTDNFGRSTFTPVWSGSNTIPAGSGGGGVTVVHICQMAQHDGFLWFDPGVGAYGGTGGFTPTNGNLLIFLANRRGGGVPYTSTATWTVLESAGNGTGASVAYKLSNGTETNTDIASTGSESWFMIEVAGGAVGTITHGLSTGTGTTMSGPTVTTSAGKPALTLVAFSGDSGSDQTITPNSPFSQIAHAGAGATSNPMTIGSYSESSSTGSNTPVATWSQGNPYSVAVITISRAGSTSIYSVDGSEVFLDIDLTGDPTNHHLETLTVPFELWMFDNQIWSIRFKTDTIPNGSGSNHYVKFEYSIAAPTTTLDFTAQVSSSGTYGKIILGSHNATKTDWVADTWYTVEVTRLDTVASIKVWADSESKPTSPQVSDTANYSWAIGTDAVITVDMGWQNMGTSGRQKFYLDDIIAGCIETPTVTPPTPTFGSYTRDRMLISIRASFTDDNLYNHALVIGTGDKTHTYVSEVKDTDSASPTRIASIGDRVFKYESDQISTQEAADKAATKVFLDNCLVSEDIDLEAICNPAFEGNDVIAVQELTFSDLNKKFRIRAFTIPLSTSRQVFKLSRVITL